MNDASTIGGSNPDLLQPGVEPKNANAVQAPAKITAPMPVVLEKTSKQYVCTSPNAKMIRTDGKVIPFVFGFCETNNKFDIEYLEAEIEHGNTYVRRATDEEARAAHMRMDPRGTMRKELLADPEVRAELEASIRAEMEGHNSHAKGIQHTEEDVKRSAADEHKLNQTPAEKLAALKTDGATVVQHSHPAPISPTSSVQVKPMSAGN